MKYKYEKGVKVEGLEMLEWYLIKNTSFIVMYGSEEKVQTSGWVMSWQLRYAMIKIKKGEIYVANKRELLQ